MPFLIFAALQGINKLTFTQDCRIIEMISAQKEIVPLQKSISPEEHNNQVEVCSFLQMNENMMMLSCDRLQIQAGFQGGFYAGRVLCGRKFHWLKEYHRGRSVMNDIF